MTLNFVGEVIAACIAAAVAAWGWFIAARQQYDVQHRLDLEREQRAGAGLRRIIIADIRLIAMRLEPWTVSFTDLRLDDLITAWKALSEDLRNSAVVGALNEHEFEAVFNLFDQFGRDTGFEQRLWDEHTKQVPEERRSDAGREFRQATQANFATTIGPLLAAGKALGDSAIVERSQRLRRLLLMAADANPYLKRDELEQESEPEAQQ